MAKQVPEWRHAPYNLNDPVSKQEFEEDLRRWEKQCFIEGMLSLGILLVAIIVFIILF